MRKNYILNETKNSSSGSPAVAASHGWMTSRPAGEGDMSPVNANQLVSISAMISYIAHHSGQSEFRVERNLADRFNIPNAKCLLANDFDKAIRYLSDSFPAST